MEQIDNQEVDRLEMGRRLSTAQDQITELEAKLEKFGLDMEDLGEKRVVVSMRFGIWPAMFRNGAVIPSMMSTTKTVRQPIQVGLRGGRNG